jgi:Thioesterase-like superfamily
VVADSRGYRGFQQPRTSAADDQRLASPLVPDTAIPAPGHFYELEGDVAVPSELTRGPWDEGSQHAGPPAALLGRALERLPVDDGTPMRIGRVTYELLRPVPIAPLRVEAWIERGGRRVQMLGASLHDGDEEVMRARAWRLRTEPVELGADFPSEPPGHAPTDGDDAPYFPTGTTTGYHTALDYRFVRGGFLEAGPAVVWMRSRVAVVAGERLSPIQRVLVVADSGNGVSAALDWRRFLFINVDLTVHLHRHPAGEWVCLDAVTRPEADGIGVADTALSDEAGRIGRAVQTLLVAER